MNYKSFSLGDWIGHISGVIEDETTLDGNEMRDLVEFLSTLKQEPCEDTISRQAAIDSLDALCQEHRYKIPVKIETYSQYNEAWQDALDRAEGAIFNLPSVQPERKKGKWLDNETSFADGARQTCTCSICGRRSTRPIGDFCRWCGADMRGEQE